LDPRTRVRIVRSSATTPTVSFGKGSSAHCALPNDTRQLPIFGGGGWDPSEGLCLDLLTEPDHQYTYEAFANIEGMAESTGLRVQVTTPPLPPLPTGLSVELRDRGALVSWSPTDGALGYQCLFSGRQGNCVGLGAVTSVLLEKDILDGGEVRFALRTVNEGGVSPWARLAFTW
jgi:hypothetical protein